MSPTSYRTALFRGIGGLDGVEGFEPPNDWTKTSCLTAWRYPNLFRNVGGIIEKKNLFVKGIFNFFAIIIQKFISKRVLWKRYDESKRQ